LEDALAAELRTLGVSGVRIVPGGVSFAASLEEAYAVCLWARTAERVLLELARFPASGRQQLYDGVRTVDWADHLSPRTSIACQAIGTTPTLRNSHYAALVVKDAIVDALRDRFGERPMVNVSRPDVRLQLLLRAGSAVLSLDLSGEALHRRGYRTPGRQGQAPLKETLAAGVLAIAGWPQMAADGVFVDPVCGSGTLPLEAALIAADIAPGAMRHEWGFTRWRGHDETAWRRVVDAAEQRRVAGVSALGARARERGLAPIMGFDKDPRAIALARSAILRAGLSGLVAAHVHDARSLRNPFAAPAGTDRDTIAGLLAANPPYGERLQGQRLDGLYDALGDTLQREFRGWRAAVLLADELRAAQLGAAGLRPAARLHNGPIPVTLVRFDIGEKPARRPAPQAAPEPGPGVAPESPSDAAAQPPPAARLGPARQAASEVGISTAIPDAADLEPPASAAATDAGAVKPVPHVARTSGVFADAAQQFADRLHRNVRVLGRPLRRRGVDCYRVYDADLPDFNLAIDLYAGWAHVQEYQAPAEIDPAKAAARLQAALRVLPTALDLDPQHVVVKTRRRQRGANQYERLAADGGFLEVHEGAAAYLVNLTDRIDTGLFLHQRLVRELVMSLADDRSFLNLFGYTGTATVAAALGGAFDSITVDLSSTYLDWAQRNFARNGLDPALHRTVHTDCLRWLRDTAGTDQRFDLILLGPPTFSNSTSMGRATLDIQRDHVDLVRDATQLLSRNGILLFVCGAQRFSFDAERLLELAPLDLSARTLPADFSRRRSGHHVWRLSAPVRSKTGGPAVQHDPARTHRRGTIGATGGIPPEAPRRKRARGATPTADGRSGEQAPRRGTGHRHTRPPWLDGRPPGADTWTPAERRPRPAKPGVAKPSHSKQPGSSGGRHGEPSADRPGSGRTGGKPARPGRERPGGGRPGRERPGGGRPGGGSRKRHPGGSGRGSAR
jgi:23S rRNA (guanine2445-N2)-methyltransferase / 23S rRNA (guanine2069-N7)-methyltransferase